MSYVISPLHFLHYQIFCRDDPDQQNLIDWIQEGWLQCCGIEGPSVRNNFGLTLLTLLFRIQDWNMNIYFNCSSVAVGSREACGVPFSCCKPKQDEVIKNKQCGYDVRKDSFVSIGFYLLFCFLICVWEGICKSERIWSERRLHL